jgi:prepilin-type processing-associated H-X9-DG protein
VYDKSDPLSYKFTYGAEYHRNTAELPLIRIKILEPNCWIFLRKISTIQSPSKACYLSDSVLAGSGKQIFLTMDNAANNVGVCLRHNIQANVLFFDGHINACDKTELKDAGFIKYYDKNGDEF